jgi:ankyrin repeat protein
MLMICGHVVDGHGILDCHTATVVKALAHDKLLPQASSIHKTQSVSCGDVPVRVDIHHECTYQCRNPIILQEIDNYPDALSITDEDGCLPLHRLLENSLSTSDLALILIEKYAAALYHRSADGNLPIHLECKKRCRSTILSKCIELHPQSLSKADNEGCLPLHLLLVKELSSIEDALFMIEKYPAALQHPRGDGYLPLHIECRNQCRLSVISKCIELHPGAIAITDNEGCLPLHRLLVNESSSIDAALMLIEEYPAALRHMNGKGRLPLHIECKQHGRSAVLSKCIELYPGALAVTAERGSLPLHTLLSKSSSIDDALFMIKKYPAALQHRMPNGDLPLHIECGNQSRTSIILKCIELYPQALDDRALTQIIRSKKVTMSDFRRHASLFSRVFTTRPMSLYDRHSYLRNDVRANPYYRRKILNLLPHHVFTPTHESDYRDLNWQPRAAMMILLSQMRMKDSIIRDHARI